MTNPAVAAEMATRFSSAKLIVSGSSAEQPSPARPKAKMPATDVDTFGAVSAGQAGAQQGAGDRRDHLRQEHRAYLLLERSFSSGSVKIELAAGR